MAEGLLESALAWAERGFRVFPLIPGDNRPRVDSFDWCTENRDTLAEKRATAARQMFEKHEAEQKAAMARPAKGREAW